jgi:hypothetical protein
MDRALAKAMMIIVDGKSIEDNWRNGLFARALATPFTVAVADIVWSNQLASLPHHVKTDFLELGLRIETSPPEYVERVRYQKGRYPSLTVEDCFSLVLAEYRSETILVASDPQLRQAAEGVLVARLKSPAWLVSILDGFAGYDSAVAAPSSR